MTIRKLKADEIECRVAQVLEKGCTLLLYKTARVDRAILTEVYGDLWQNDFKVIDGKMYGGIAVYNKDLKEWLWRWDCGTESQTEAEKGQASDCFKRAGFKWGIGIELYSAPFIFVNVPTVKDGTKYRLVNKFQKFEVKEIEYSGNEISNLVIIDDKKNVVYQQNKLVKKPEPEKKPVSEQDYNNEIDSQIAKQEAKFTCSKCSAEITKAEYSYSNIKYGAPLCRKCQASSKKLA